MLCVLLTGLRKDHNKLVHSPYQDARCQNTMARKSEKYFLVHTELSTTSSPTRLMSLLWFTEQCKYQMCWDKTRRLRRPWYYLYHSMRHTMCHLLPYLHINRPLAHHVITPQHEELLDRCQRAAAPYALMTILKGSTDFCSCCANSSSVCCIARRRLGLWWHRRQASGWGFSWARFVCYNRDIANSRKNLMDRLERIERIMEN